MSFRQNRQRDERRRRVLCDESSTTGAWTGGAASARAANKPAGGLADDGPHYTEAARCENQPPLTSFVPARPLMHVAVIAALLTVVAGVVALDHYAPAWAGVVGEDALRAFDLAQPASLAGWFSAIVLAGCAASAGLVYRLRRHRIDDYRGRYRIWLWAVGGLLVLSVDAVAGLHRAVGGLLVYATQTSLLGDNALGNNAAWWMLVWAAAFGSLGAALLYDLRGSRAATTAGILAAVGYLAAALLALGVISSSNVSSVVLSATCALLAHCCTFVSIQFYARYVILDAEGKLPARRIALSEKRKSKSKSDAPSPWKRKKTTPQQPRAATPTSRRSDLDAVDAPSQPPTRLYEEYEDDEHEPRHAARRAKKQKLQQPTHAQADDDWEQPQQRKLSKAERKRLRKQKMLERMDDAA